MSFDRTEYSVMDCNDLTEDTDLLSDSLVTNDQKEDAM